MQQQECLIINNQPIACDVYALRLLAAGARLKPGQFVNISLPGLFLRRPLSVADWDGEQLLLVYKLVGRGTAQLAAMPPGQRLDLLLGLGNGFDLEAAGEHPLLIGGGVGTPPLLFLGRELVQRGVTPRVLLGFNAVDEAMLLPEFSALGLRPRLAFRDGGSGGETGLVSDLLATERGYSYTYACGPRPMLRAVYDLAQSEGDYSFEERMGCGFGACMGCSCQTTAGAKRLCKEGPVLKKGEIIW